MNAHEKYMQYALSLALKGLGQTSPNPTVGAVIVKNNHIVGSGWHKKAGLPHAEINALRAAGKKARGADLYVTLEPCCHFGRTPPCTDAIIKAGIKRVFYGMKDPNPKVADKGLKILKGAGIKIVGPILEDACIKLNRPFVKWITSGVPYVTAKIAITLDGKIADYKGNSKWISNEAARDYAHTLRAASDIVMVGAGTAKKDRPKLNVRLKGFRGKQPLPIVVGSKSGKRVNLKKLLQELGAAGFQSVLVEGGSELHTELIRQRLVDYIVVFIAPKLLGNKGLEWLRDMGRTPVSNPVRIIPEHIFTIGDNVVLEGAVFY